MDNNPIEDAKIAKEILIERMYIRRFDNKKRLEKLSDEELQAIIDENYLKHES